MGPGNAASCLGMVGLGMGMEWDLDCGIRISDSDLLSWLDLVRLSLCWVGWVLIHAGFPRGTVFTFVALCVYLVRNIQDRDLSCEYNH